MASPVALRAVLAATVIKKGQPSRRTTTTYRAFARCILAVPSVRSLLRPWNLDRYGSHQDESPTGGPMTPAHHSNRIPRYAFTHRYPATEAVA